MLEYRLDDVDIDERNVRTSLDSDGTVGQRRCMAEVGSPYPSIVPRMPERVTIGADEAEGPLQNTRCSLMKSLDTSSWPDRGSNGSSKVACVEVAVSGDRFANSKSRHRTVPCQS